MVEQSFDAITAKEIVRHGQVYHFHAYTGNAGAASGWISSSEHGSGTLPQSETGSSYVIPLSLKQGWIITGWKLSGQIESAGNTATLDGDLRATTAAAADNTVASIGAITQISVTADTLVESEKTGLSHTVISGEQYAVRLLGTTGVATDIAIHGIEVTVTEY